jgi:hypothetical protein
MRRAKQENGGLGEDPPGKYYDLLTGLRTCLFSQGSYEAMLCLGEQ